MFVIVFIIVFGLLVYFFNIFNSAQAQVNQVVVNQVVHPTNNISHVVTADIHNAYTGFLPYISYWMYALGGGIVVALIFIIATSIREEGD